MLRPSRCPAVLGLTLLVVALAFLGCSGGGPTLPPPDQGDEIIEMVEFIVETGQTRTFNTNTTVRVTGEVRIDGDVTGADGSATGEDGVSIIIEAGGDIVVRGTIVAGDGATGGTDAAGGSGGVIALRSTGGDVTIGAAPAAEARVVQIGATELVAGDGADGGDGLTGGAGGAGGSIHLECPDGTLTLNLTAGLLRLGTGGRGGTGVMDEDDLGDLGRDVVLTNSGGDGGLLHVDCATLEGVDLEETGEAFEGAPVLLAWLDDEVVSGGAGGDAGDFYFGVDPGTGETTWTPGMLTERVASESVYELLRECIGQNGGHSDVHAGSGGSVDVDFSPLTARLLDPNEPDLLRGAHASVVGGFGGDVIPSSGRVGNAWAVLVRRQRLSSGSGGSAICRAGHGQHGAPGVDGGDGGNATASGGAAGQIFNLPEIARGNVFYGLPGVAEAYAGHGGNASAGGGDSRSLSRPGGGALALGGDGGNGGDGSPPGTGAAGGMATARGGPGGPRGDAIARPGGAGADGSSCQPPPTESGYQVAVLSPGPDYARKGELQMLSGLFNGVMQPRFRQTTLGNTQGNAIYTMMGQTLAFTRGGADRLFIGTIGQGILMYDNPMSGGDRPPDVTLVPNTDELPRALWYDEVHDHLYVLLGMEIMVWHGAAGLSGNRQPDRVIEVDIPGALWIQCITGDWSRGILYVAAAGKVHSFDGAGGLNGVVVPDRTIIGAGGVYYGTSLACDPTRDRLYVGAVFDANLVLAFSNASSASGVVAPTATVTVGEDYHEAVALAAFGAVDELLVGVLDEGLMLFRNASELADNARPDREMEIDVVAMGARLP